MCGFSLILEDPGHPLLTASIPTVKYGEKENIRSQSPASRVHQLAKNEWLTRMRRGWKCG